MNSDCVTEGKVGELIGMVASYLGTQSIATPLVGFGASSIIASFATAAGGQLASSIEDSVVGYIKKLLNKCKDDSCKKQAIRQGVQKMNKGFSLCNKSKDPKICKEKLRKKIISLNNQADEK